MPLHYLHLLQIFVLMCSFYVLLHTLKSFRTQRLCCGELELSFVGPRATFQHAFQGQLYNPTHCRKLDCQTKTEEGAALQKMQRKKHKHTVRSCWPGPLGTYCWSQHGSDTVGCVQSMGSRELHAQTIVRAVYFFLCEMH